MLWAGQRSSSPGRINVECHAAEMLADLAQLVDPVDGARIGRAHRADGKEWDEARFEIFFDGSLEGVPTKL
jgi:hypothetical protein